MICQYSADDCEHDEADAPCWLDPWRCVFCGAENPPKQATCEGCGELHGWDYD